MKITSTGFCDLVCIALNQDSESKN